MTLMVSPWVVWGVLSLALFGLVFLWRWARQEARGVWAWWRRDRVAPLLEDDNGISEECASGDHWECEGCWCDCGHDIDLPPEQSAADLGFTGPGGPPSLIRPLIDKGLYNWVRKAEEAPERRAPWWEAEHRAAYDALGFDYPSGLMARVRELAS